jgi:hypothetical protein
MGYQNPYDAVCVKVGFDPQDPLAMQKRMMMPRGLVKKKKPPEKLLKIKEHWRLRYTGPSRNAETHDDASRSKNHKKNTKKHCLTPKTLRLRSRGPSRYAKKKQKNHDDASRSGSKDE